MMGREFGKIEDMGKLSKCMWRVRQPKQEPIQNITDDDKDIVGVIADGVAAWGIACCQKLGSFTAEFHIISGIQI